MADADDRLHRLESEIERRLLERFAGLRDEFDRLRLESDRRWAGFLSRFDQDFTGIVPPELVLPEPAAAPSEASAGTGLISIELARSLDNAGNQVEALHRFLELCRQHASRAALLISKSGSFVVWKATGFSESGGNDEATRRVTLPMDVGPLSRVIEGNAYRLEPDNELSLRLGAADVAGAVLVPMVVKEKVSGAVYADTTRADSGKFDPESIAFLTFLAGLFVDRLAGRKLKPAPALRPFQEPGQAAEMPQPPRSETPAFEEAHESAADEFPARGANRESFGTKILSFDSMASAPSAEAIPQAIESPPPSPSSPPMAPRFSEPDVLSSEQTSRSTPPSDLGPSDSGSPEPSLAYEPDEPPAAPRAPRRPEPAKASFPPSSALSSSGVPFAPPAPAAPPATAAAPAPVAPPAPPPPAQSQALPASEMPTGRISTGARRLAGPLAPLEGDERHEEARRFAKLLVSEIKLYNEKAVLEGRQHGDLYDRLKEDIDRSRQMYDERIPEDVRASTNFFYEELVRILADGRAEALGI